MGQNLESPENRRLESFLDSQVAMASFSHCCDRFLDGQVHGKKRGDRSTGSIQVLFPSILV